MPERCPVRVRELGEAYRPSQMLQGVALFYFLHGFVQVEALRALAFDRNAGEAVRSGTSPKAIAPPRCASYPAALRISTSSRSPPASFRCDCLPVISPPNLPPVPALPLSAASPGQKPGSILHLCCPGGFPRSAPPANSPSRRRPGTGQGPCDPADRPGRPEPLRGGGDEPYSPKSRRIRSTASRKDKPSNSRYREMTSPPLWQPKQYQPRLPSYRRRPAVFSAWKGQRQ